MEGRLSLLVVHAHPDDESLSTGGTLAKYAQKGVETFLVCCTKGEEGEYLNPSMDEAEIEPDISQVRMKELEEATRILGVKRVYFLGYRDSGTAGKPSNLNPDALMNADMNEATGRLVRIIREVRPQVVITYNERGLYGHPDHIAANRITLSAIKASPDPSMYPEISLPPWRPLRLFYIAIPTSRLIKIKEIFEKRGERFDYDIDFMGTPDEDITTVLDVREFLDKKIKAIYSHKSQIGPKSMVARITDPFRSEVMGKECYVCVIGCSGISSGDDLFQGIYEMEI
jgi:LmbE family N-acetylglucosaminyl deacetylase